VTSKTAYPEIVEAFKSGTSEGRKIIEFMARIRGEDPKTATAKSVLDDDRLHPYAGHLAGLPPEPASPNDPNILTNDLRRRRRDPTIVNRGYVRKVAETAEARGAKLIDLQTRLARAEKQAGSLGFNDRALFEPYAQNLIELHQAIEKLRNIIDSDVLKASSAERATLASRIDVWQRTFDEGYEKLQNYSDPHARRGSQDVGDARGKVPMEIIEAYRLVEGYLRH
jgi:hypothetical protein